MNRPSDRISILFSRALLISIAFLLLSTKRSYADPSLSGLAIVAEAAIISVSLMSITFIWGIIYFFRNRNKETPKKTPAIILLIFSLLSFLLSAILFGGLGFYETAFSWLFFTALVVPILISIQALMKNTQSNPAFIVLYFLKALLLTFLICTAAGWLIIQSGSQLLLSVSFGFRLCYLLCILTSVYFFIKTMVARTAAMPRPAQTIIYALLFSIITPRFVFTIMNMRHIVANDGMHMANRYEDLLLILLSVAIAIIMQIVLSKKVQA